MKQRLKWIALLTALFVLHAPLCAFGCTSSQDVVAIGSAAESNAQTPPCHAPDPTEAPSSPGKSDPGCGDCEASLIGAFPHAPSVGWTTTNTALLQPRIASLDATALRLGADAAPPGAAALPPPDILLLKSTLII